MRRVHAATKRTSLILENNSLSSVKNAKMLLSELFYVLSFGQFLLQSVLLVLSSDLCVKLAFLFDDSSESKF